MHNMDLKRLPSLTERDLDRNRKYPNSISLFNKLLICINIIFHINYKSELYVLKFTRIPIYSYDIM